jgi:hypothetical protein
MSTGVEFKLTCAVQQHSRSAASDERRKVASTFQRCLAANAQTSGGAAYPLRRSKAES